MSTAGPGPARAGEPSSSRRRSADDAWPEPFLEALAVQVAMAAATTSGKLSAAPAVVALFQVCSSWRAISQSELLWQNLTRGVWSRERQRRPTWRAEFAHCHRLAGNFRRRLCTHSLLLLDESLACRRLSLSDRHLAAGFLDGSVRVFDLASRELAATFVPNPSRDVLGSFSRAISGLLFDRPGRLVYASQDGDIHVAALRDEPARRVRTGNAVEDGTLVDFAGRGGWWVGLFAGVPGRSLRVWSGGEGELAYVGGSLTDPDAVVGWHMFTDRAGAVGRVRFSDPGTVVGCTASRMFVVALDRPEAPVAEIGFRRGAAVEAVDACEGRVMVVDEEGLGKVIVARSQEEVCRFNTGRRRVAQPGAMNWGYAVVCGSDGAVGVWDAVTGEFLYAFRERTGGAAAAVAADERRVAVWCRATGLHLWDFGHS
ncbi:transducin/WD40 repeat-like superfamily protein isoform X2 [Wolffia australiana]